MPGPDRRQFLGTAAAGLAAPLAFAQGKKVAANEKVTVALIGCGGMGRANLRDFVRLPDFEVVALCDPDPRQIENAANDLKQAGRRTDKLQTEKDFRKVLERKDLDCVIVGTPDHWHAYVLIAACASGKDVYCEKPLSHNIVEGRKMVEAARRHKRVVQIGTQQRSGRHFQDAVKYVQSGKLGPVSVCRTWITNRDRRGAGSPPDGEPPAGVDYDLWLGPAPKRPFNPARFHHDFRWWWDYGNGLCNDWGVHLNDIILWGMKVSAPLSVFACGGKHDVEDISDTPDVLDVHYEYPGFTHVYTVRRGDTLFGFHGKSHGMEFEGADGTLTLDRGGWFVTPRGEKAAAEKHGGSEQHFAHVQNFLHCLRNRGERPASEIEDMHRATTTCHLANISYKVKRRIWWDPVGERCYRGYDPAAGKFVMEDAEANALLLREPRKPWSLEA
ncbi:MAG TPA: Gfo/Idh/MocA family oxidoreductase [Gemmataceae bacterium]